MLKGLRDLMAMPSAGDLVLYGEDIVRGYVLDVYDTTVGEWRSTARREGSLPVQMGNVAPLYAYIFTNDSSLDQQVAALLRGPPVRTVGHRSVAGPMTMPGRLPDFLLLGAPKSCRSTCGCCPIASSTWRSSSSTNRTSTCGTSAFTAIRYSAMLSLT